MLIYSIQIICLLMFGAACWVAWRRHELWLVIIPTIYAALFENLDVLISRGQTGSYFYNEKLLLIIVETPLFIILSWGIIFYCSWLLARGLTKSRLGQTIIVPLLATIIDFGLDPVATKMDLWTWVGYTRYDGILGIPLANFAGWYLVLLAFMISLLIVEEFKFMGHFGRHIILPLFSFTVFMLIFNIFSIVVRAFGISLNNQLTFLFAIFIPLSLVSLFIALRYPAKLKISFSHYLTVLVMRLLFYTYALAGLFLFQLWGNPVFIALLIFSLTVEIAANIKFNINAKTKRLTTL